MAKKYRGLNEKVKETLSKKTEDDKCISTIKTRISESKNFLTPYRSKWEEWYQIYQCIPNSAKKVYNGRANLYVPIGRSIVDRYHSKLTANKPKVVVVPRKPEYLDGSMKMSKLVDYYWDQGGFKAKYKIWVKDMLIPGLGCARLTWKKSDNYTGPWLDILDITSDRVHIDPTATLLSEIRWYAIDYDKSYYEIKNNPNYTLPSEKEYGDIENPIAYDWYNNYRLFLQGKSQPKDSTFKKGKLTEYIGLYYDEATKKEENYCIVFLNDQYIIRKELWSDVYDHNELNIHFISDNIMPHELIPMGEIEPIAQLQYELNDTRNQRMDNVTNIMHRMFKVNFASEIDDSELVWRPGGLIHTSDMNGIEPLDVPDVTISAYNEETMIKDDMKVVSQVDDRTSNLGRKNQSAADTTAKGMAMQDDETNAFAVTKLDNIEDGLVSMGKQMIQLIQQFMPKEVVLKLEGKNIFQVVSRDDIQGEYDFTAEMGVTQPQNRMTRRSEARELVATIGPYLQVAGESVLPKFKQALKFLIDTYEIPDEEPELTPTEQMAVQSGTQNAQPPILTPSQTGVPLEGMQQMYGSQGTNLGGSQNQPL